MADPRSNDDRSKRTQISLGYILIALLLIFGLQFFLGRGNPAVIPYSEFKQALEQGQVREVVISPTDIRGVLAKGNQTEDFNTTRVDDPQLVSQLEAKGVKFTGRQANTLFGQVLSWILPIVIMIAIWNFTMRRMNIGGAGILNVGQSKAKLVADKGAAKITFADVAGIDEAKEELVEVVDFLQNPHKFEDLGGRIPRGVLLVGAPGTGKTLLAKAVAGEAGVPFFSISGSEFVEMFVGVGAARVRDLFNTAMGKAPCIIFIDELDALGKARGFNPIGGHDEREQTLNQLLVEMDGFDPQVGVILLAATNRPEILDPALLRPGRFDLQVLVDRPDRRGREAILRVHLKKIKYDENLDIEKLANMTPGMVGADLANIVNEAALLTVRRDKEQASMSEFQEAVERVIAGLEKKNRVINPKEKKIVAYHELGHAIVAMSLPGTDPVQKITVIPRGIAALGYTMQVPTEDRFLMSKTELENKIASLLGGRAAEQIVSGDISTGAHNDLSRATDIARSMVKEYGMSNVGQVYYAPNRRAQFLNLIPEGPKDYSEATAEVIDQEINGIISAQYDRALEILSGKRGILEESVAVLLEKETIEGDELKRIMAQVTGTGAVLPAAAAAA